MSDESNDTTEATTDEKKKSFKLPRLKLTPLRGPRDFWQIPLLVGGTMLVLSGAMVWIGQADGPDFEGVLDDAEHLIAQQDYDGAMDMLNGPILEELGSPEVNGHIRGRLHALRGDALYLGLHERLTDFSTELRHTNHETILHEYHEAEEHDHELMTPRRHGFLAEMLLDLGEIEEAIEHIEHLPEEQAERRIRLWKQIVEHHLVQPSGQGVDKASEVLEQLRLNSELSETDRIWIVARHAEIRLAGGHIEEAIDELLPEIHLLYDRDTSEAGELFLLLGQAYVEQGHFDLAREHLLRAESVFVSGDERRGRADSMLARIAQTLGEFEEARDRYSTVIERFPSTNVEMMSLLGLGEVEADLGRFEESREAYARLVELLPEMESVRGVTAEMADTSIRQRHQARMLSGDLEMALAYAKLIKKAYASNRAPPATFIRLAETHRALADGLLGMDEQEVLDPIELLGLDPIALEAARFHYQRAGEEYRQHATRSVVREPEVAALSLWNAADSYDRAGDQTRAIELFTEYRQTMRSDPRSLEATFRLARSFQALGQHQTAITLFSELIKGSSQSDEAYRSYVPLAKSHLIRAEDGDFEEAERWLLQVTGGRIFEPRAPQFRAALVELGRMYLARGRYGEAIARLREVLERYGATNDDVRIEFDLADALRLSATKIERQLHDAMSASDRAELTELRLSRLDEALARYDDVRVAINEKGEEAQATLYSVLLRNATFYRADIAYDLGRFDEAIRYYDAAAQRYADDAASLVAMVQIVNCYVALERWREAQTAHVRAQGRLRELPEEAWSKNEIPMDRRHWERWLASSIRIEQMSAYAEAGDPSLDGG